MIASIQQELLTHLPAWEAHKRMAPPIRTAQPNIPAAVRKGAVSILLFSENKQLQTLLIKRADDGKTHSGQIALPGGKLDDNDFSFIHCALRECEEEIGLAQHKIKVLGNLSPLFIPPSNFLVQPVVCWVTALGELQAAPNEVAEIIKVPFAELFNPQNKSETEVKRSDNKNLGMTTPGYTLKEHLSWGATAMMLAEFEDIDKRCL